MLHTIDKLEPDTSNQPAKHSLDDLDAFDLLDQEVRDTPETVTQAAADSFDPFDLLDQEVRAITENDDKEKLLKLAAKQARNRANDSESRRLEEELTRLRDARQWTSTAIIALFSVKNCKCGTSHAVLTGLFERQENEKLKASRLIAPSTGLKDNLPRGTDRIEEDVEHCASCVGEYGFDLSDIFEEVAEVEEELTTPQNPQGDAA